MADLVELLAQLPGFRLGERLGLARLLRLLHPFVRFV